jgi:DNA-directed RNA polymerase subunit RPC12/RpoP
VHQVLSYHHLLHLHQHDEKMRKIQHILNKNLNDLKNKITCIFKIKFMFCYLFVSFIKIRNKKNFSKQLMSFFDYVCINNLIHFQFNFTDKIMVVFHCGSCGEALKKNQVDKHIGSTCRRVQTLSCIDCGKDFTYDITYFIYLPGT